MMMALIFGYSTFYIFYTLCLWLLYRFEAYGFLLLFLGIGITYFILTAIHLIKTYQFKRKLLKGGVEQKVVDESSIKRKVIIDWVVTTLFTFILVGCVTYAYHDFKTVKSANLKLEEKTEQFNGTKAIDVAWDVPFYTDFDKEFDEKLRPVVGVIAEASIEYGVDVHLIKSIIKQESGGNPDAVSRTGVRGIMQITRMAEKDLEMSCTTPENNIRCGVKYFRMMLDAMDGNIELALASYNAGGRYVRDAIKEVNTTHPETVINALSLSGRKRHETLNYVLMITNEYKRRINLDSPTGYYDPYNSVIEYKGFLGTYVRERRTGDSLSVFLTKNDLCVKLL